MSQTTAAPELTGTMFLFGRPELLNKEQHGKLGIEPPENPYAFCGNVRAIPVTANEIMMGMKHYPIVFLSAEDPTPLAIVGLVDDVNLFVSDTGQWEENVYIPGYVRRYPFALANESGGGDRHAIVIDGAHSALKEGGANRLFDDNGENAETVTQAIEFCKQYERERLMTLSVGEKLKEHDLIAGQTAAYTPQGEEQGKPFAQYFGVDEKRLNELSDEAFLDLRKAGILGLIYGQLMSMSNWRFLMQRRAHRFGLTETQLFEPKTVN